LQAHNIECNEQQPRGEEEEKVGGTVTWEVDRVITSSALVRLARGKMVGGDGGGVDVECTKRRRGGGSRVCLLQGGGEFWEEAGGAEKEEEGVSLREGAYDVCGVRCIKTSSGGADMDVDDAIVANKLLWTFRTDSHLKQAASCSRHEDQGAQ